MYRTITSMAAEQLKGILGQHPESITLWRTALGWYAETEIDVVELRAEFTYVGMRTAGWDARRSRDALPGGHLRRLWHRMFDKRLRWRQVNELGDLAELL